MTPLPAALGGHELIAWRLIEARLREHWDSGEGAYNFGGRWNSRGVRAVYCSIDPATAILEVAVHKGFNALDAVPHVLTSLKIENPAEVFVLQPQYVEDPTWLSPGLVSPQQQRFGDTLLAKHKFVAIPSTVSAHSWNLVFARNQVHGAYALRSQEAFVLDARLHAPATAAH